MYSLISVLGFVIITNVFNLMDYEATFQYVNEQGAEAEITYELPALIGPNEGELISEDRMNPLVFMPEWLRSDDLNTVVWALASGLILYGGLRLGFRKRIGGAIQPILKGVNPQMVDEVSYRAIAIGFPVFTLGGLIFAMIWLRLPGRDFGAGIQKRYGRSLRSCFMQPISTCVFQGDGTVNGLPGYV